MLVYDPEYYGLIYPHYARETQFPLLYYLSRGWKEGHNPGPGFNTAYYLNSYPDVAASDVNPLVDYERRRVAGEVTAFPFVLSAESTPADMAGQISDICYYLAFKAGLFDPDFYRAEYKDLENVENVLEHYRHYGWKEGRKPSASYNLGNYAARRMPSASEQDPLLHLMANSLLFRLFAQDAPLDELEKGAMEEGVFDPDYYVFTYPDARRGKPFYNFLSVGMAEQRNPSATFNTEWYVERNPDAADNPVAFYLEAKRQGIAGDCLPNLLEGTGLPESLSAHCGDIIKWQLTRQKLFDAQWYLNNNPDIDKDNALEHFGRHGWREKRDCGPNFSCSAYALRYLANDPEINPYCHFIFVQNKNSSDENGLVKSLQEENDLLFEQLHGAQQELERMRERLKAAGSDKSGRFQDPSARDKRIAELENYQKRYNELIATQEKLQGELENYKTRYYVLTRFFHDQMRLG